MISRFMFFPLAPKESQIKKMRETAFLQNSLSHYYLITYITPKKPKMQVKCKIGILMDCFTTQKIECSVMKEYSFKIKKTPRYPLKSLSKMRTIQPNYECTFYG